MTTHVHVVCARCDTVNRVRIDRMDAGARCGSCRETLLSGRPFDLTAASLDAHLHGNELPLVVDFWAPWCGPCRSMAPAYAEAAARLASEVRLAKLDTEREPALASRFGIRSIPTLILFRNGRETARQSGAMDVRGLLGWIGANVSGGARVDA